MNLAGWLIVLGAVGSAVGFTLFGMGSSTLQADGQLVSIGSILTVGGLLALVVGLIAYKATQSSSDA